MTREEAIQFLNECRERAQKNAEDFEREFPQYQSAWRKDVEVYGMAISALRQQDVTDTNVGKNKPLTLDELREAAETGEPVWLTGIADKDDAWARIDGLDFLTIGFSLFGDSETWAFRTNAYGLRVLAYRQKP